MADADAATDDDTTLAELVEFNLSAVILQASGDLMLLLRESHSFQEDGSVPDGPEDSGPFKGGWKLMRDLSVAWKDEGCPRYVLSASMASLLVSTKAPRVTHDTLAAPYNVFVVEVPGEWTSMPGTGPLTILLARIDFESGTKGKGLAVVAARRFLRPERVDESDPRRFGVDMPDVSVRVVVDEDMLSEDVAGGMHQRRFEAHSTTPPYFTEAVRYLVNTCCFVTAHTECAPRRSGRNAAKDSTVHDVRPPENVTVTAEFRRHAQNLVASRRVSERKEALLHIVRGHWKRQVRGSGGAERSLIWIRPYQRGAESLGRVVERAIKLSQP